MLINLGVSSSAQRFYVRWPITLIALACTVNGRIVEELFHGRRYNIGIVREFRLEGQRSQTPEYMEPDKRCVNSVM